MTAWLLKSIGVSDSITDKLDQVDWLWARPQLLWVGLLLLVPAAVFIAIRQKRNLPNVAPRARWVLTACRIGVLLLLVVVLAGPYVRLAETIQQKPIVALIVDESASMSLPAGPFDDQRLVALAQAAGLAPGGDAAGANQGVDAELRKRVNALSRAQLGDMVLAHGRDTLFKAIGQRFELRRYRVARRVRTVADDAAATDPPSASDAAETALGAAIQLAVDEAAGRSLAAIVLVSDGRWTTGPEPLHVVREVAGAGSGTGGGGADAAGNAGIPVWTVPVGSEKPFADVVLLDVLAPAQAAKGDHAAIVATVASHGFAGRNVAVKLLEGDKVIDEKQLTLSDDQRQQAQLTFEAAEAGDRVFTVQVDEQPQEQVKVNNRQNVFVEVTTDRQKVLYLEGVPRWDFRFLDHALRRDHGLEVTIVMESALAAAGIAAGELPAAAKLPQDAAGFAAFNTVILGDVSPGLLPARYQAQLAKAVQEDGVGLIVESGTQFMPHAFVGQPLFELLPVTLDDERAAQTLGVPRALRAAASGLEAPAFAPFGMKVTAAGSIHPAFQLYDNATKNRAVWDRMPTFFWAAASREPRPGSTVLAQLITTSEPRPLIAEQYAGRGRVLFLGMDSTFRWRRNIGSHLFYRFWGQAIRRVARQKKRSGERSWIELTPRRVEPGEPVAIELYAVDAQGQPLRQASVALQVARQGAVQGGPQGDDNAESLTVDRAAQPGHFTGTWRPPAAGEWRISHIDGRGAAVSAAIQTADSNREMLRPIVDRDLLGNLADATGGGLLELDQLHQLPAKLKGKTIEIARSHEEEIWDNWLTLVLLAGLYCLDVGVRRMMGLT